MKRFSSMTITIPHEMLKALNEIASEAKLPLSKVARICLFYGLKRGRELIKSGPVSWV